MSAWIIEPRDTLVLRDGKPMKGDGLTMSSLPMPFPSATAGFFRTQSALDEHGRFRFPNAKNNTDDEKACEALKEITVKGPILYSRKRKDFLFAAPNDALTLAVENNKDALRIVCLKRIETLRDDETTNLPKECEQLIGTRDRIEEKPTKKVDLWHWDKLETWLIDPKDYAAIKRSEIGLDYPDAERRTHVKIDGAMRSAEKGKLFSIDHRRLVESEIDDDYRSKRYASLALYCECDSDQIKARTTSFAGERRIVFLKEIAQPAPELPEAILKTVVESGYVRVYLATPGYFEEGFRPTWLLKNERLTISLLGACVDRPMVVSGWDLAKHQPKPTRRLAPAGSIYFLKLDGDAQAREAWCRSIWWHAISDDEQARRDGFGMALLGSDPQSEGGVK